MRIADGRAHSVFSISGQNYFDLLDFPIPNIMLSFSGLLIAFFTGWLDDAEKFYARKADFKLGL